MDLGYGDDDNILYFTGKANLNIILDVRSFIPGSYGARFCNIRKPRIIRFQ